MHLSTSNSPYLTWITFFIFSAIQILPFSLSDPRISEAGMVCGHARPPPNTSYIPLFVRGMEVLSQSVTANDWGYNAVNSTNISIYSLAQCHDDLSHNDCLQCYAASRTRLPRCLPAVSGRIFLDGCFFRYDSYGFFNESVDAVLDSVNCNSSVGVGVAGVVDLEFEGSVGELIDNLTAIAVVNEGYAVRGSKGVFGLAECWNTVSREGCRACLVKANREIRECLPSREGRALNAGCYMRYSTEKFFSNQSDDTNLTNNHSGVSRAGVFLAIALPVLAFSMLCLFAGYVLYGRWEKRKKERSNLGQISFSYNKSNLNFKYETLEKATNYFDQSRKLGQGGAGSVYKGTLPNGKSVAVKRLFFSTRQWVDEFFNEVNLISGIKHKNLVQLLGCSIEGPESLLVHEFVPNKSLEHYLFDTNKVKILNWEERYNIIVGTAEGIAFLHEGCQYRIIHRDIKSSNVILDENFEPKIADFGLARCFGADKTHLSTGIAGTLGYMAPEYLVKGQLTEKADVYSYGVLVLETVCARKNNAFVEGSGPLLQTVWKLFKTYRLTEAIDPCLKGNFPATEASRVLRIGLLCAQASVAERPSMSEVVQMLLTDEDYEIPEPKQPPFINTSALSERESSSSSTRSSSYSINSLKSHLLRESFSTIQSSTDGQSRSEEELSLKVGN